MGWEECGFNCWGSGDLRSIFLFCMNLSGMSPRSRFSSQLLMILAPWVLFYPPDSTLRDCLPFP